MRSVRLQQTVQSSVLAVMILVGFGLVVRTVSARFAERLMHREMMSAGRAFYYMVLRPDAAREWQDQTSRPESDSAPPPAPVRVSPRRGPPQPPPPDGRRVRFQFIAFDQTGRRVFVTPDAPPPELLPAPDREQELVLTDDALLAGSGPPDAADFLAIGNFHDMAYDGRQYRYGVMRGAEGDLVVLADAEMLLSQSRILDRTLLVTLLVAILIVLPLSWWQANRSLRPVYEITERVQAINAQALDARLPAEKSPQEYRELIGVLNDLLARLEGSFEQARRFSADAAHELRTPLTVLQGEIEAAVNRCEMGSEHQQTYISLLDEVEHLKVITRKLLLLSLADAERMPLDLEPLNLSKLLPLLGEDIELLGQHLEVDLQIEEDLWVRADRDLLTQTIRNLFTNAVKYNNPPTKPEDAITGVVVVRAVKIKGRHQIQVGNTGELLTEEDAGRVFERFYRRDRSHSRRVAGAGLGLSLASEIVRAHGGRLYLATGETQLREPKTDTPITTFVLELTSLEQED